jgi:hypothetical protein
MAAARPPDKPSVGRTGREKPCLIGRIAELGRFRLVIYVIRFFFSGCHGLF